jgi:hypothetical protein
VDCYFYSLENCLIDTQISDSVTTHTSTHLIETLTWAVPNLMGRRGYLWYRHNTFQNTMPLEMLSMLYRPICVSRMLYIDRVRLRAYLFLVFIIFYLFLEIQKFVGSMSFSTSRF